MKLISNWKKAYKMISMQAMALAIALQSSWEYISSNLKEKIPDQLVTGMTISLLILGIIGRLVKQESLSNEELDNRPRS